MPSRFIGETGIIQKNPTFVTPFDFLEYQETEEETFKDGDKVIHETFGLGVVVSTTDEDIKVAFDYPHGVKIFIPNHPALKKVKQ